MDILWSPWRSNYINSFKDEDYKSDNICIFCDALKHSEDDKSMLIVHRAKHCFVILNKYPYNGGHVMVAPNRHIAELEELSGEEMLDIMMIIKDTTRIMKSVSSPHGFNVGANLGRVAGAGVPGHLHFHVVPRWSGDTSFMTVVAETKVVSQSLEEIQKLLSDAFINLYKKI